MSHFFASQRLIVHRFTPLDLDEFVAMRAEPEVARFQSWETFTENCGRAFLESNAARNPGEPGWFQFALERKGDRKFIGDCGIRTFETDNRLSSCWNPLRKYLCSWHQAA
jgi:RimJ/RimL family protein N-acetyltransferase